MQDGWLAAFLENWFTMPTDMPGFKGFWSLLLLAALGLLACSSQRWEHFTVPTPIAAEDTLIIGFQGGRDDWNNEKVGVGRMAARLRELQLPRTHIQTVENTKRDLALRLVKAALDRNQDGRLDDSERQSARIILYGESFGGAAVVKFARQLQELEIPVLLTVQVDSVGRNDEVIPSNVKAAANLYQRNGKIIRGPQTISAQDPNHTEILGSFLYDYSQSTIDISDLPWHKTFLRSDHVKMDRDPRVWQKVEEFIVEARHRSDSGGETADRSTETSRTK